MCSFLTIRTLQTLLFPQAAGQTSSCFASLCISEMKSHIFSQHAGMARPHYSTHWGIHNSTLYTATFPLCWKHSVGEDVWFFAAPPDKVKPGTVKKLYAPDFRHGLGFEAHLCEIWEGNLSANIFFLSFFSEKLTLTCLIVLENWIWRQTYTEVLILHSCCKGQSVL